MNPGNTLVNAGGLGMGAAFLLAVVCAGWSPDAASRALLLAGVAFLTAFLTFVSGMVVRRADGAAPVGFFRGLAIAAAVLAAFPLTNLSWPIGNALGVFALVRLLRR